MTKRIAGVYFYSGKANNFIACIFDYFESADRWLLSKLHLPTNSKNSTDQNFEQWLIENKITDVVVDFPTSKSLCETCPLVCPGEFNCSNNDVISIKQQIEQRLRSDHLFEKNEPKNYERARNSMEEYDHHRSNFPDSPDKIPLSKSLKKRLKRGFTPYWNRPIDVYIWLNYYDQLLKFFNYSYDSFGHTSLMTIQRFAYLRNHISGIKIYESNIYLNMIELLRANILTPDDLLGMKYVDEFSVGYRKKIISKVESNLNIYMKEEDSAKLTFDPKAINSFMLGISGIYQIKAKKRTLPNWCLNQNFIIPDFLP